MEQLVLSQNRTNELLERSNGVYVKIAEFFGEVQYDNRTVNHLFMFLLQIGRRLAMTTSADIASPFDVPLQSDTADCVGPVQLEDIFGPIDAE